MELTAWEGIVVHMQNNFIKMLKDVGITMLKSTGTRCSIAGKTSADGMRNKEQHEG